MTAEVGTVVAGYRIVAPLGRGGTSVVYRAEHVRLDRPAALKLLVPGSGRPEFRERFLRESKLAASLNHPAIVPVYDAGEENGLLYIAMACVEGDDLRTVLANEGRLPLRRALRIVAQVASALDAAHARGLVHRDVKPANILIGPDDRAYLSDFGVAKELASAGTTRTGSFVGTLEYSAPEQIEGRAVDARTDVYALACVLHECLAGMPPFHRSSDVAVLNAHLHAPPARLSRAAPELPPGLEPVLAKALSKSPLDRFASPGELVAAARAAVSEPRIHHRRLAVSLALLAAIAAAGVAVGIGVGAFAFGGKAKTLTATVVHTRPVVDRTLDSLLLRSTDGQALNDEAFALIQAHDYPRALPFAERAARYATPGTLTRGYATFNYGLVLLKLGRCQASLVPLRRALRIEAAPQARYIKPRITQALRCVQHAGAGPARSPSSAAAAGPSPRR